MQLTKYLMIGHKVFVNTEVGMTVAKHPEQMIKKLKKKVVKLQKKKAKKVLAVKKAKAAIKPKKKKASRKAAVKRRAIRSRK